MGKLSALLSLQSHMPQACLLPEDSCGNPRSRGRRVHAAAAPDAAAVAPSAVVVIGAAHLAPKGFALMA